MTRKHFVDIAQALSESKPDIADDRDRYLRNSVSRVRGECHEQYHLYGARFIQEELIRKAFEIRLLDWNRTCLEMGKALQRHNNRFEMQRFLFACGMDRENESQEVI